MEFVKITLFALLAGMLYGILHDQVTAHLAVEYFTMAHPPLFPTESPFWLAIGWGIAATWWLALPLGLLLAVAARVGARAKRGLAEMRAPIGLLLGAMALSALIAGIIGYLLALKGAVGIADEWGILAGRKEVFMVAVWAHLASYASGILGGLTLILLTLWRRYRTAPNGVSPR